MIYCFGKSKAVIEILGDEKVVTFHTPVEVNIQNNRGSSTKCWKVKGVNYQGKLVAFFTCAENGELRSGRDYGVEEGHTSESKLDPYGLVPIFDGQCWNGAYNCRGRFQSASINIVNYVDEPSILNGNCSNCLNMLYTIIINDATGIIYQKDFSASPKYKVNCDDECPPDHCKCPTIKYPGYCCLPCKEIAARINNLAARI